MMRLSTARLISGHVLGRQLHRSAHCRFLSVLSTDDQMRMAVMHHAPAIEHSRPKFKSPRKRATSLMHSLQAEAVSLSKAENPDVWDVSFRVGDAVEFVLGLANKDHREKVRGVVLGRYRKGMDEAVLIRDIIHGVPIERRILLHSPLVRSIRVIEENFVYKGRRRVKRSKLYYVRDMNPNTTRITK